MSLRVATLSAGARGRGGRLVGDAIPRLLLPLPLPVVSFPRRSFPFVLLLLLEVLLLLLLLLLLMLLLLLPSTRPPDSAASLPLPLEDRSTAGVASSTFGTAFAAGGPMIMRTAGSSWYVGEDARLVFSMATNPRVPPERWAAHLPLLAPFRVEYALWRAGSAQVLGCLLCF